MLSTPAAKHNDPHDAIEIAPDVVLVARAEEELSRLARETKNRSDTKSGQPKSQPQSPRTEPEGAARDVPAVDTSFRAARIDNGPSLAQRVGRGVLGLLLAICIGGAAVAWRASSEVAKEAIANWAPQFALKSSPPADSSPPAAQDPASAAAPVQQASAEAPAATQDTPAETPPAATATPAATTPLAAAAAAAIPAPADQTQQLQSMARDLASLGQEVTLLKASLAELKASNEQMSHELSKVSEQNQRLKMSALQAKPAVPPVRKPVTSSFRPSQAAISPAPPPAPYPPSQQSAPYPQSQGAYPPPQASAPYPPPQTAYVPPPQPPVDPDIPRPPMPLRQ